VNGARIAVIAVALFVAAFIAGYVVLTNYHYGARTATATTVVKRFTTTTVVPSYTTVTKYVTRTTTSVTTVTTSRTVTKYVYTTTTRYVAPQRTATPTRSPITATTRTTRASLSPAQLFASIPSLSIKSFADLDPVIKSIESSSYRAPVQGPIISPATLLYISQSVQAPGTKTVLVTSTTPQHSTTTVQVEGVDELDIAKTDSRAVYYLTGNTIYIINASSDRVASRIALPYGVRGIGLYVWRDRLVVVGQGYSVIKVIKVSGKPVTVSLAVKGPVTYVMIYNVSNLAHPRLITKYNITGVYVASRLYNGFVYIVVRRGIELYWIAGQPYIPIIEVDGVVPPPSAIMVPPLILGGYYPRSSYVVISCLDLHTLRVKNYVFVLTDASKIYMVPGRLYIVSSAFMEPIYRVLLDPVKRAMASAGISEKEISRVINLLASGRVWEAMKIAISIAQSKGLMQRFLEELRKEIEGIAASSRTAIYEFRVNGLRLDYVGEAIVNGSVLRQFAVNQLGNYLVVATTVTSYQVKLLKIPITIPWIGPRTPTTVTIPVIVSGKKGVNRSSITITISPPRPRTPPIEIVLPVPIFVNRGVDVYVINSSNMKIVAVLKNVVKNEVVYGARLVGHVLFLVTARRIDPLFAIDLSNPLKPRVVGYVKMPGYITFLQPVAKGVLLGIGIAPSRGWWSLKIQLFNVTNLRNITVIATLTLGRCRSQSLWNYHAITFDFQLHRLYIPLAYEWRVVGAAVIKYSSAGLKLLKVLVNPGTERVVWVGNKVFVLAPHQVKVFTRSGLEPVATIPLASS